MKKTFVMGWASAIMLSLGCSTDRSDAGARDVGAADGGASEPSATSAPIAESGGARCMFSADCKAGTHCDLGECVQSCNVDVPCADGETCSPRGRCVPSDVIDQDPPPVTKSEGRVWAEPSAALLTDRDGVLPVRLVSDSAMPVEYRIEIDAPHLGISKKRGTFQSETTLDFLVDASSLEKHNVPGSIRIFTNLGNVAVSAPIKAGLTGTYQGALVYDGAAVPLGGAQVVVDVIEDNGDVLVQIDPDKSLLFPRTDSGAAAGRGIYTETEGIDFAVKQLYPADFGGERNHFKRPIGRELRFRLTPNADGSLQGSFEESIHGLLGAPVHLRGSVHLEPKPVDREPVVELGEQPLMPVFAETDPPSVADTFPGWTPALCVNQAWSQAGPCAGAVECGDAVDRYYHGPLEKTLSGALPAGSDPLRDVVEQCELEMLREPSALPVACALVPVLACSLSEIERSEKTSEEAAAVFSRLLAHTLDPALLVAQNHIVDGVKESFERGFDAERDELEKARAVLAQPASWVMHPRLLDYLSRVVEMGVSATTEDGEPVHHMALRVLTRLLYVVATIDGEMSRLSVVDKRIPDEDRLEIAQQRGILGLLEAALMNGVLEAWGDSAPPGVATEFTGVLVPADAAFSSLLQGAIEFGVPEGYIPFLYDPRSEGATNFQQVVQSIQSRLSQQKDDESAFMSATREFEQNQDALLRELDLVRLQFDQQIGEICGSKFELDSESGEVDWSQCGAFDQGEVGALLLEEEQAYERLLAAQSRIKGMRDRIEIERNRISDVRDVREGTISLMYATGEKLDELTLAEGIINASQKFLELASNSNVMNFGASAGMGIAAAAYEMARTEITLERQQLQRHQEIQITYDNATVEVINGMATIKTMLVDMAQLQLEMRQDLIAELQAAVNSQNALERAKRLYTERTRVLARVNGSPLSDPAFRMLADRAALQALRSRSEAQRALMLAGRALEYELNQPLGSALEGAVVNMNNASETSRLANCLDTIFNDSKLELGTPQAYSTEFSVRERLGIVGPRHDAVTGEDLSEGEQFRRMLLRNENFDGLGSVGVEFSSNLEPGNGLWPSNVCDDKIASVEAQIVGDFLGDNEAQIALLLEGGGVLRDCGGDGLVNWSTASNANVQAGVNTFGTAPSPNTSLAGLSVASAKWRVAIPGSATAPANGDLDLSQVEDIVFRVRHQARPIRTGQTPASVTCLSTIGAGL